MPVVNMHEAKTQLSRLVAAVQRGEEVTIAKAGTPVAKLVAITPARPKYVFGVLKGKYPPIGPEFDEPLPDDILAAFHGEGE